jgi:hypothetical protein
MEEIYDELPDLKMTALAILYQTKWMSHLANKPNAFVVKETLAIYASSLQDDDIGYFYDPNSPNSLCTSPGELVGRIANSKLPYSFDLHKAVQHFKLILNAIDENDYNKHGVIVVDCLNQSEAVWLMEALIGLPVKVYALGKCYCADGMILVKDSVDLITFLHS